MAQRKGLPRLLFTVEEAAAITQIGRTKIFEAIVDGRLTAVKAHSRTRLSQTSTANRLKPFGFTGC
jgi:excisionase family DNA binding protein